MLPSALLFRRQAADARIGRAVRSFTDLRPGDYVVHEDHGVGHFVGFDTKTVAGVTRDYLCLDFKGSDKLFVPHEQIAKVSRYIGSDARAPVLSKLGGKAWHTLKARARHAVHELAGELLALYAARQASEKQPIDRRRRAGRRRSSAAFPYTETDDQARAIEAVKADLEIAAADGPADLRRRRLRQDRGGAARGREDRRVGPPGADAGADHDPRAAALRRRSTTASATPRSMIEVVSRFRQRAELKGAVAGFREGKVDILIGTHRVLSRDVVPAELGLVIVDEEQRFGVAQKEILRQLRTEVDVLALSATPIPRTLHMSLSGLRDISVIATPPRGRRPVRTHVGECDAGAGRERHPARARAAAARRSSSTTASSRSTTRPSALRQLVPEARVAVGHGQMTERQLETVMESFVRGDARRAVRDHDHRGRASTSRPPTR